MKACRVVSVRASAMLAYIEKQSVLFLVLVARKYPDSDMWHINLKTTYGCLVQRLTANYVLAERGIDESPSVNSPSLCIRLTHYTQPCIRLPHLFWSCTLTPKTKYRSHSRNHCEFNVRISCIFHGYSGNCRRLWRDARTCVDIDVSCSASCS